jgi:hypothetical protein
MVVAIQTSFFGTRSNSRNQKAELAQSPLQRLNKPPRILFLEAMHRNA